MTVTNLISDLRNASFLATQPPIKITNACLKLEEYTSQKMLYSMSFVFSITFLFSHHPPPIQTPLMFLPPFLLFKSLHCLLFRLLHRSLYLNQSHPPPLLQPHSHLQCLLLLLNLLLPFLYLLQNSLLHLPLHIIW